MAGMQGNAIADAFMGKSIFSFPATPSAQGGQNYQPYGKPALPNHLLDDGASYEDSRQQRE